MIICCEQLMNETLRNDERLRALCLSGSLPIKEYVKMLTDGDLDQLNKSINLTDFRH